MYNAQRLALDAGLAGDLEEAAGVGSDDDARACALNVFEFAATEAFSHFGFGQVVRPGSAATKFGFRQVDQFEFWD